jgi:cytochrome oxidase Cu insertion factor (SCO1/SenC/PrrC family)
MEPPKAQLMEARADDIILFDLELVDKEGAPLKFKSEVIGDRLVVVNFIYTTCTTACPIQTAIFSHLQEALGPRLGTEVFLVSLSVDPATDVPPRLKAYAEKHKAREGWIWLTGRKSVMDEVLLGLRAYSSDLDEHPSMILIGDGKLGGWTRYYGFPRLEGLLAKIDELAALKKGAAPTGKR